MEILTADERDHAEPGRPVPARDLPAHRPAHRPRHRAQAGHRERQAGGLRPPALDLLPRGGLGARVRRAQPALQGRQRSGLPARGGEDRLHLQLVLRRRPRHRLLQLGRQSRAGAGRQLRRAQLGHRRLRLAGLQPRRTRPPPTRRRPSTRRSSTSRYLTSWNNKQAPGFGAADGNWSLRARLPLPDARPADRQQPLLGTQDHAPGPHQQHGGGRDHRPARPGGGALDAQRDRRAERSGPGRRGEDAEDLDLHRLAPQRQGPATVATTTSGPCRSWTPGGRAPCGPCSSRSSGPTCSTGSPASSGWTTSRTTTAPTSAAPTRTAGTGT